MGREIPAIEKRILRMEDSLHLTEGVNCEKLIELLLLDDFITKYEPLKSTQTTYY